MLHVISYELNKSGYTTLPLPVRAEVLNAGLSGVMNPYILVLAEMDAEDSVERSFLVLCDNEYTEEDRDNLHFIGDDYYGGARISVFEVFPPRQYDFTNYYAEEGIE